MRRSVVSWSLGHRSLRSAPLVLMPALGWFLPTAAWAQLAATVSATGQYQYDSNVFDVQRGFHSLPNEYQQADEFYAYGAALNLADQISQQNIYLRGSVDQFEYDHFTQLTHYEYNADAGWLWKIGSDLSGSLDVSRSRVMVPFTEIIDIVLNIDTDQRENATLNYLVSPEWRLETNGYVDQIDEPIPGEPQLQLNDTGGGAALRFLGAGAITAGVDATYQHGDYLDAIEYLSPSYNQWSGGIVATYQPSGATGPTTVDFAIGYTSRVSPAGLDKISGTTGHLDYNRQITGKTSFKVAIGRNVNNYIATAGAEIDSTAAISALWQATYKSGFNLGYTWTDSYYPEQGYRPDTNRTDHLQFLTFGVNYAALQWLTLKPYANFQTRSSNYYGANFNATVYGLTFTVQWQNRAAAP